MNMVGGIDAAQFQMVFHPLAQIGKRLSIKFWNQEQGGTGVKMMPIFDQVTAAPACSFFFYDSDPVAMLGQSSRRGNAADTGPNHQSG